MAFKKTYLHDVCLAVFDGLDLNGVSETTLANYFQFAISIHSPVLIISSLFSFASLCSGLLSESIYLFDL